MREPTRGLNPAYLNFVTALPEVLARWHADSQFLDAMGRAAPLPLKSGDISLASLIGQVLPGEDPSAVVDSLLRLRGIRRRGNFYVPTDRQLRFDEQNVRAHALRALLGMLRTIDYNVRRATPDSTIFERAAVNLEFPVWALPAFHKWLKREARVFLWKVYTSMGRRASRRRSGPTTCLGVGVFAFEDPMITGTPLAATGDNTRPASEGARAVQPSKVSKA